MNNQKWLDAAEVFDFWRVVPRVVLFAYLYCAAAASWYLVKWYTHLPFTERDTTAAAFVGAVFTMLTGFATVILNIYSNNGRDLNAPKPQTQTTTLTQTTIQPPPKESP